MLARTGWGLPASERPWTRIWGDIEYDHHSIQLNGEQPPSCSDAIEDIINMGLQEDSPPDGGMAGSAL
jgi:hypothetical protein